MVQTDRWVRDLVQRYAAGRRISESYSSRLLTGSGDTLDRMARGTSLTGRRVERILQRASDHWPPDLAWPSDIPRPAPTPGSPAAEAASTPSEQDERLAAARELGPSGRVRRPAALLEAIGLPAEAARATYDDVCKRYRDDGPAGPTEPRRTDPPSWTARILDALVDAGDVRFKARRDRRERNAELAGRFGFEGAA